MLEILDQTDTLFFLFLNKASANPVFDLVLPFITQLKHWIIPLAIFAIWLLFRKKLRGLEIVIVIALSIIVSDQLTSQVLKPFFERARPCEVLDQIRVLLWCNSSRSFPSAHAANSTALATAIFAYFGRLRIFLILALLVASVSFSRIYIGVHYPFDVLAGIFTGYLCAKLVLFIRKKVLSILGVNEK